MSRIEKLLEAIRINQKNIRFSDLAKICDHYFGYPRQQGTSHISAMQGVLDLVKEVVTDMQANGETVPVPLSEKHFSGKFQVRIPPEQHRNLAITASEQGISLNRYVSSKLSG